MVHKQRSQCISTQIKPHRESEIPHDEWYSHHVRRKYGAWGPPQRRYIPLEGLANRSLSWRRERVLATAARFIGYGYQHHYVPDWNPPANWPWKECCAGHNGKGVDCSNFTTFVYNQGFGIHMNSAIGRQAELRFAQEGPREIPLHRIELPVDYQQRQQVLATGDLLYIRGRENGPITHVVLWVGTVGRSPSISIDIRTLTAGVPSSPTEVVAAGNDEDATATAQ